MRKNQGAILTLYLGGLLAIICWVLALPVIVSLPKEGIEEKARVLVKFSCESSENIANFIQKYSEITQDQLPVDIETGQKRIPPKTNPPKKPIKGRCDISD